MTVIILLLGASLTIAIGFLVAFCWGVRHQQFEDAYSPPRRILFDDPAPAGSPDPLPENKK